MDITTRHVIDQNYPLLEVRIDGRRALIGPDHKLAIREAGYVVLNDAFDDLFPPVRLLPDPSKGRDSEVLLHGACDHPTVLAAFDRYVQQISTGTFQPD